MWWIPLVTAAGLGLVLYFLNLWQRRRDQDGSRVYRSRYVQLVAQLESLSLSANQLVSWVPEIKDEKVLDYYESSLRVLETLLAAICKLHPFGTHPPDLDSAFFLARDCRGRIERTQKAFREALKGNPVRMDELRGRASPGPKGCYFCSRPYIAARFSKVRVKIDDEVKDVVGCNICKEELEHTKKVKVLYFLKDGKPVHWSDMDDYVPSEDYWDINRKKAIRKTRQLELIKTTTNADGKDLLH